MKKILTAIAAVLFVVLIAGVIAAIVNPDSTTTPSAPATASTTTLAPQEPVQPSLPDVHLTVDANRWPNVADHISDAIAAGESDVCTLDRLGADERREDAISDVATRDGFDRDEYPHAICKEGGEGASVRLVPSGENRSHGAWLGNQIEDLPDGTKVLIEVGQ